MKKLVLLSFIFGALFLSLEKSSAQTLERCPYQGPPKVTINFQTTPIKHDYTKNATEITLLSRKEGHNDLGDEDKHTGQIDSRDGIVIGLHVGKFKKKSLVDTKKTVEENRTCLHMRDVTINYTLEAEIYVTKDADYRNRKKCFDSILKHEMEHNIITKKSMLNYKERFTKQITAYVNQLSQLNTVNVGAGEKAKRNFKNAIAKKGTEFLETMHEEMNKSQQAFHASEESATPGCDKVTKKSFKDLRKHNKQAKKAEKRARKNK